MNDAKTLPAIATAVQTYFEGMHFGDPQRLRAVVHADAFVTGYYHGDYTRQSLAEWLVEVEATKRPSESGEPFDMHIVSVDVSTQIAVVKVAVLYLGLRFTDYLTLADLDGGWRIVHKSYVHD